MSRDPIGRGGAEARPGQRAGFWWPTLLTGRPEYTQHLDVAEAASQSDPTSLGITVSCWAYTIGVRLLMSSPAEPGPTAAALHKARPPERGPIAQIGGAESRSGPGPLHG